MALVFLRGQIRVVNLALSRVVGPAASHLNWALVPVPHLKLAHQHWLDMHDGHLLDQHFGVLLLDHLLLDVELGPLDKQA